MIFRPDYTIVLDCYKYSDKQIKKLGEEIIRKRKLQGLLVTRTANSYASEIKTHKRLYKLGIAKKRTKDCDCEENIDITLKILYYILGS
jgi:hypothetical protein